MNNTSGIKIRNAKMEDVYVIKELSGTTWDEAYKHIVPQEIVAEIKTNWHKIGILIDQIIDENTIFKIAQHKGTIVGILSAQKASDKFFLTRLYVLPNCQRMGIGRMLLKDFQANDEVKEIELEVEEENRQAIMFYEKEMFSIIGESNIRINNYDLKTLKMGKILITT